MDKENDENLPREEMSGIETEDPEQGNSRGFSPMTALENEPARPLQLSQSFFVADTCEDDDESMMIPPTQEFLVPSTPPPVDTSEKEGSASHGQDDTTISNLDESYVEEAEKAAPHEDLSNGSENDMTQDLPELDETQQILVDKPLPTHSSKDLEKETQGDDDDWNLKFSETQETQELLGSARMRRSLEKEEFAQLPVIEEETKSPKEDSIINRPSDTPKLDQQTPTKSPEIVVLDENESEDEIEPSQSCLAEFPRDTYSAYRDQLSQLAMDPPTAHSTPDNTFNGTSKDPKITAEPDVTVVPSPIINPNGLTTPYALKESVEERHTSESTVIETETTKESSKDETLPVLILDSKSTERQPPVLVLDTQPEELADEPIEVKDGEKKVEFVVDTIELMSSVEESMKEVPKEEAKTVVVKAPDKEEMEVSCGEDVKVSTELINSSEEPENSACMSSGDNSSTYIRKDAPSTVTLSETLPATMLPPPLPISSRLSRKQTFDRLRKFGQPTSQQEKNEKQKKSSIGTFQDSKTLENIFNNFGISLDHESSEAILSLRPNEEVRLMKKLEFTVRDNRVFLDESFEICPSRYAVSPHSSLHSGEMADISSSSSAKSANFSSVQTDTSSTLSSQENKTSTQNSDKNSFSNVLWTGKKDNSKALSPIKSEGKSSPVSAGRSKRGAGRKAAAKPNNKTTAPAAKRKRGRPAAKSKVEEAPKTEEAAQIRETDTSVEARPRKTRRKISDVPPPVEMPAETSVVQEISLSESSGDAYVDSPYGSILPGMRVMARWKDGYYYPGEVVSQEMEGRWSIRFDDNDIKVIPQENLIKVAILERGTPVFAKSPDDFYDPGIVCGHFREGRNVGYEVELADGVTKRYPRTSVILSTDQAKDLPRARPPTTPATKTINLDNLIDGKRKRKSKSLQSPEPVAKKSPGAPRMRNIDPNVDSTADSCSSATENAAKSKRNVDTTETEDEPAPKQRNTRKRKAAKAGATKITRISKQSSSKNPKLFKDYGFLLTNADRKPTTKSYASDTGTEEAELIPFDKDELVNLILSRGGLIIETFEDVQKCRKKNIYLLANTYLRTMKYIKCLAAGIPCIKHCWIQNCCYKGEILDLASYRLPSGESLITNLVVEWHGKSDVLKGVKISLISSAENPFVQTWAPVLLAAKADFVQKWNLPSSKQGSCPYVDVLVTNPYCPSDVLSSARRRKIPIVSSEWIIQSLIAGKRLPYDAHPKFKHDFTD